MGDHAFSPPQSGTAASLGGNASLAAILRTMRVPLAITDPRQHDNPIVFANDAFLQLCGYSRDEVIQRNCRFLQGPATDLEVVGAVREAVAAAREINVELLNYRKDGSTFWNELHISPIHDETGDLSFFFAMLRDVTRSRLERELERRYREGLEEGRHHHTHELQIALDEQRSVNEKLQAALQAKELLVYEADHRVKNNLQMISSLLALQGRNVTDQRVLASLAAARQRVETLSAVHRRLHHSDDIGIFDAAEFARDLVSDLVRSSGRTDIATAFEVETVEFHPRNAAAVALILNELVTNALKHAFPPNRAGTIMVRIAKGPDHTSIVVSDDGVGMADEPSSISFGTVLVRALSRQLNATTTWSKGNPGTRVEVQVMTGATV
jgi:PAS domain S-box-containing protein